MPRTYVFRHALHRKGKVRQLRAYLGDAGKLRAEAAERWSPCGLDKAPELSRNLELACEALPVSVGPLEQYNGPFLCSRVNRGHATKDATHNDLRRKIEARALITCRFYVQYKERVVGLATGRAQRSLRRLYKSLLPLRRDDGGGGGSLLGCGCSGRGAVGGVKGLRSDCDHLRKE